MHCLVYCGCLIDGQFNPFSVFFFKCSLNNKAQALTFQPNKAVYGSNQAEGLEAKKAFFCFSTLACSPDMIFFYSSARDGSYPKNTPKAPTCNVCQVHFNWLKSPLKLGNFSKKNNTYCLHNTKGFLIFFKIPKLLQHPIPLGYKINVKN